jgi:CheY-like chemotaxis protein
MTNQPPQKLRILHVEDSSVDALLLERVLTRRFGDGFELVKVSRLGDAMQELIAAPYDLILLDLSLPDSQGPETCARLFAVSPDIPIVVVTGLRTDDLEDSVLRAGACGYLTKDELDGPDLGETVERTLRGYRQDRNIVWPVAAAERPAAGPATATAVAPAATLAEPPKPTNDLAEQLLRDGGARDAAALEAQALEAAAREVAAFAQARASRSSSPRAAPAREPAPRVTPIVAVPRRSVECIPALACGGPAWDRRVRGELVGARGDELVMELPRGTATARTSLLLALETPAGVREYAAIEVVAAEPASGNREQAIIRRGGALESLLRLDRIIPKFDPQSLQYRHPHAAEVLEKWAAVGVLRPFLLDRVDVCRLCRCVATFRQGCRSCGSARVTSQRHIHHFACAHAAPADSFQHGGGVRCPKCRAEPLVVGRDFEYMAGPYRCADCQWTDSEYEHVGQCLGCGFRFARSQALEHDLTGFDVRRLDLLALVPAS